MSDALKWDAEIDGHGAEPVPVSSPTRIGAAQLRRARWERQLAEVFLTLWEASPPHSTERIRLKQLARQSCAVLRKFARIFPIARPRTLLWQGRSSWLAGHAAKAHKLWHKSLAAAERLAMPREQQLAREELGTPAIGDRW